MPEAVLEPQEISLNAVRYRITGPVQRSLASVYPGKTVFGDYTKDSSPNLSVLALSDHRGGIGQDVYHGDGSDGSANRSWYSTADIRFKGHLILPPLVTTTANLPTGATTFDYFASFAGEIFLNITVGGANNGIYKYNDSTTTWGSALETFATGNAEDAAAGIVNGTPYVVYGRGATYRYSSNGTSFTTVTPDPAINVGALLIWDNKLWIFGANGIVYFNTTIDSTTPVNAGQVPTYWTSNTTQKRLITGSDANGNTILFAVTPEGVFAHDFDNYRFLPTNLQVPDLTVSTSPANRFHAVNWRGILYFSSETTIYEYAIRNGQATIRPIGPDRDDGLPSGYGTLVQFMAPSLNDLIIGLNGSSVIGLLLAWNGEAWRVLTELGSSENFSTGSPFVSGAYASYRVWFASDEGNYIRYIPLLSRIVNPLQVSTYTYAAAATHDWPWFTAGQSDVTKVAVRVKVETRNPTTSETVKVYYAINRSATFQIMTNSTYTNGTVTAAGIHTFDFPSVDTYASTTALTGTAFRSIQFRVVFARGGTTTNTPDVLSLSLEYYKKLDPKWQFQVDVDMNGDYKGRTPKELRAALLTAQESSTLVEFTYRDPDANSDATFYVQARPIAGAEQTGHDERGSLGLALVEV